jgi:hypothetical protein
MPTQAFDTQISETDMLLTGPWRRPKQMLHAQVYDSHASIHDDATAQKLGFQGGPVSRIATPIMTASTTRYIVEPIP